jgi:alcohol dehydrogenase class IV
VEPFELRIQSPGRILFGAGVSGRLATVVGELGGRKALLLTDQGLSRTGLPQGLCVGVAAAGIPCELYDQLAGEPDEATVDRASERFRAGRFDFVIGVGGGSALDTAKAVAALGTGGSVLAETYGKNTITREVGLVLVPTTAGTGSEATPNALFIDAHRTKQAVISPHLLPDVAVLDPSLTLNLPPRITAATGMDALAHCVESWLSVNGNALSEAYAYEGVRLVAGSLETAVANGANLEARGNMLLGSLLGGLALTIAGTTAVHALSYPLGKRGVPHGVANGLLLPRVLEFNRPASEERLAALAPAFGLPVADRAALGEAVVRRIQELLVRLPVSKTLGEVGVEAREIPAMAAESLLNERLLRNNPRSLSQEEAEGIYRRCL